MKLEATNNHVIVKMLPKVDKTEGGIIVPDTAVVESFLRGEVISIGPAAGDDIKVGDVIACHNNGGQDMLTSGIIYKCLKYDEIYCKVS